MPGTQFLGYRKTPIQRGRSWVYAGEKGIGKYNKKLLGLADDFQEADGVCGAELCRGAEVALDRHAKHEKAAAGVRGRSGDNRTGDGGYAKSRQRPCKRSTRTSCRN